MSPSSRGAWVEIRLTRSLVLIAVERIDIRIVMEDTFLQRLIQEHVPQAFDPFHLESRY